MKKKVVTLLLSLTLASGVMGCGGAEAAKADVPQTQEQVQQEQGQEVKQEEQGQQENEREYKEYEYFFSTSKLDLDNPDSTINYDELSPNGEYCGEYILLNSVKIYASRDEKTYEVGYTKPNIPIACFNSSADWINLYFENEESPNDYRLIKVSDFLGNYVLLDPIGGVVPKRVGDSKKLQRFVDDDNYYTFEEYWTQVDEIITEREKEHIKAIQDYKKEHPDFDFDETTMHPVEVFENKDEFEEIGSYVLYLTKENCMSTINDTAEITWRLEEYYKEVTVVQDEYVDYKLYGKMKEEYK